MIPSPAQDAVTSALLAYTNGITAPIIEENTLRTANHRLLVPATLLWGADVALFCNFLSHLPGDRGLLPLNAITPLLGVPVVLYILFRRRTF